jgi:hypothetical protein
MFPIKRYYHNRQYFPIVQKKCQKPGGLFHCNFCWADNDNSQVHIIIIYREAEMLHCCHCNDCMILGIIVGANSEQCTRSLKNYCNVLFHCM